MKNKKHVSGWGAGIVLACVGYCVGVSDVQGQGPKYNVTFLPGLEKASAIDMNNLGQIVGTLYEADAYGDAFLYSNGTIINLGTLGEAIIPAAINDVGQITGSFVVSDTSGPNIYHAFLYSDGVMTDLGTQAGDKGCSYAFDINNAGQIVGQSTPKGYNCVNSGGQASFFWKGNIVGIGTPLPNPGSQAFGINDNYDSTGLGEIVGYFTHNGRIEPFTYSNGEMVGYTLCPYNMYNDSDGTVLSVNNVGQFVGYCVASQYTYVGFFYNSADKSYSSLGNIVGVLEPTYMTDPVSALDINDAGQAVGVIVTDSGSEFPFLYMNGIRYNLLDLALPKHELIGFRPAAINNLGQIVGNQFGQQGVVLLTPISDET